jgi:hypothetical protein
LSTSLKRPRHEHPAFLFFHRDSDGYLIATCEANGVNPVAYIADVLMRIQTHAMSRIDELLTPNWGAAG